MWAALGCFLLIYVSGRAAAQSYPYGNLGIELRRDSEPGAPQNEARFRAPESRLRPRAASKMREEVPTEQVSPRRGEPTLAEPWTESAAEYDLGGDWAAGNCGQPPLSSLFSVFAGIDAFKGPVDQGQNGNHGVHEGFNMGIPLSYLCNIGGQFGVRGTQSNFSGTTLSPDERNQVFVTAGIFRRKPCGLQWGAAADWLDERYYVDMNLVQGRGEISWIFQRGGELGAMVSSSSDHDEAEFFTGDAIEFDSWAATEQVAMFYRRPLSHCGEIRIWGGATSERDGILGGDLLAPISDRCAVAVIANYKIPDDSAGDADGNGIGAGHVDEAWSLGVSLVWYPGRCAKAERSNPFRPLFNVADNAAFMVERRVR
jgi:hypothetical protein